MNDILSNNKVMAATAEIWSPDTDKDWQLIQEAQTGNLEVLSEIYTRYANRLIRRVTRVTGPGNAEELVSRVFLNLLEHIQTLKPIAPFSALISIMTHNEVANHLRDSRPTCGLSELHSATNPWTDPERYTERVETIGNLENALDQLPPPEKRIILGHYIEGEPYKSIAARLGSTEGAIKVRAVRARNRLRGILSEPA